MTDAEVSANPQLRRTPLTPVAFLDRAACRFSTKTAVDTPQGTLSYKQFHDFVRRFSAALTAAGARPDDVISVISPNSLELLAAHYAVPAIGCILNAVNIRLEIETIAYILEHAESRLVFSDARLADQVCKAVAQSSREIRTIWFDSEANLNPQLSGHSFGEFLDEADTCDISSIENEMLPATINYTSGTTGKPKGVMLHHRGAYLNSLSNVTAASLESDSRYLWVLPMFHVNGWCHTWAVTAAGAAHHLIDNSTSPAAIIEAIDRSGITHLACAPVVLYSIVNEAAARGWRTRSTVTAIIGGASPSAALIRESELLGFRIVHVYGLTETFGPTISNARPANVVTNQDLNGTEFVARQGTAFHFHNSVAVLDPNGKEVPADANTLGEVCVRGNCIMLGYYKDEAATSKAFLNSETFRTGDLAIKHSDGSIEIRDRLKDIIISGGEHIASIEIESVLQTHESVMLAAVVAMPHEKWGEVPCAFVELRPGATLTTEEELIRHCRKVLVGFKTPKRVVFEVLPRTGTGKIQKNILRARAKALVQS